jgi:hypothetical protein
MASYILSSHLDQKAKSHVGENTEKCVMLGMTFLC